jgi:hypothetical protein
MFGDFAFCSLATAKLRRAHRPAAKAGLSRTTVGLMGYVKACPSLGAATRQINPGLILCCDVPCT